MYPRFNPAKLTAARERRGWSLARLSDQAKLGYSTVHAYEHGDRWPTFRNALALSEALGIDPQDMCDWHESD